MSMKLYALSTAIFVSLALVACDSKSEKSAQHEDHADAAVISETTEDCAAQGGSMGIHGDVSAYTKSPTGLFHVKVEWSSPLTAGTLDNKATVSFVDEHAHELPVKLKSFKLFMPAMGHGSGKSDQMVLTQDAVQTNVWTVDKVYFSMGGGAGEWVVDVEGSSCGVSDKARVIIPLEVQ